MVCHNGQPYAYTELPVQFLDGEPTAIAREGSEALLIRLCERHGMTLQEAMDTITEIEESSEAPSGNAHSLMSLIQRGLREVLSGRTVQDQCHRLQYFCLAMHWFDLLDGVDNATELARRLKVTKANANKFVNLFRDIAPVGLKGLPPLAGQRKDKDRATFARTRQAQELRRFRTA